jgi:ribosomal protein L34
MAFLYRFPSKSESKKKNSSLHGFLNRWKTLCPIPGKAKVVLNKRRRRYASFRASVYVMDGRP